jgi:internalin A
MPSPSSPNKALREAEHRIRRAADSGTTKLDLSMLGLEVIPESVAGLTHLQSLHVFSNQLKELPEFLGNLTQLEFFNAGGNELTALPESLGRLTQIQELEVRFNQLIALPDSLGRLTRLRRLDLRHNRLTALPESIGRLTALESLYVEGNQLTALPESIGELKQLQRLEAGSNRLTGLPESLGQLPRLERLYINDNQLTALPESLRGLPSLIRLYLHGNDALGVPPEILGPSVHQADEERPSVSPASILDYYFRTQRGRRPLNEAKLILVGRGGVGKTSLVNRLVYDRFNPKEEKTDGIGISAWSLTLGRDQVRLNVWDFGGQEIMHATHQFFLTRRSVYLLVLNAREGEQDANVEYWLKIIESFGAESPVIVVINKIKDHTFDLNRRGLREKYPAIRDFIQTDCENGAGLPELRKMIEREADRLENLRDPFPAEWFKVKDELAQMKQSYLSFDQYRAFCVQRGVSEPESQEKLASVLHRLGTVLNFRDDARLCDLNVLQPEWVTRGIYKLLNADALARTGGVMELSDLGHLLDRKEYPFETHGYLIDLMKKFDLCFEFEGWKGARYLIPELLGKQEPALHDWQSSDLLRFQYHYNILPEGLLPRFIVLTHDKSEGLPRWRTGVVLAFDGNEALVKADVQDRRLFITVRGSAEGRRRLLSVIRAQFEHIHRTIPKLEAVERVPVEDNPKATVGYDHLLKLEGLGEAQYWPEGARYPIRLADVLNGYETPKEREKKRLAAAGMVVTKEYHIHPGAHAHFEGETMENIGRDKITQNISGSTFNHSPVTIQQALRNCFNTIQQVEDARLKGKLEQLHGQAEQLMANVEPKQAEEVKENLEALVKEATKPQPRKKWYDLSADGLLEAARTVKELVAPMTGTVMEIGKLLFS